MGNNNFFFSGLMKYYLIGFAILYFLVQLGNCIEDEPIKREPWLPPIDYEKQETERRKGRMNNKSESKKNQDEPWENDKKEQTESWADFLEELENRGYTIYDPEAEDIWEEFN